MSEPASRVEVREECGCGGVFHLAGVIDLQFAIHATLAWRSGHRCGERLDAPAVSDAGVAHTEQSGPAGAPALGFHGAS